jgi:hypothetical protein
MLITTLLIIMGAAQAAPPPAPAESTFKCTISVQADGAQRLVCDRDRPGGPGGSGGGRDAREYYVVCEFGGGPFPKVISLDPTEIEMTFLDKAAIGPPDAWNPTILTRTAAVPYRDWLLLPSERRWGMVRRQPPTHNMQIMVSGACMSALVTKLRLAPGEPVQ